MKTFSLIIFLLISFNVIHAQDEDKIIFKNCTFKGFPLNGKIQVVDSFPDLKVQIVESFPDLKVKVVESFPDDCGEWKFVESFPDLKIQFVNSFPDIKIKF
jgi:hypothetical protein